MRPTPKKTMPTEAPVPAIAELRCLLVPIDLTPRSDRVLARVARLPLAEGARITLMHVVPGSLPRREQLRAERDAGKALQEEARHLRDLLRVEVTIETFVKVGSGATEIADCATWMKAELIVMGRGGGRALRDAFLGSTAERVVRQSKRPVLVVRLPARSNYSRPTLALELDEAAHEAVRLMLHVLPPPRPRVEVIHAYDIPYHGLIYSSISEDEADERKAELCKHAARELPKLLDEALGRAGVRPADGPSWKIHVRFGSPRIVVENAMKKAQPDLLVLGTRGHSGAAYVFLGTVAGDLLRAATCDVLLVPPAPDKS